jgi:hypothetical protein
MWSRLCSAAVNLGAAALLRDSPAVISIQGVLEIAQTLPDMLVVILRKKGRCLVPPHGGNGSAVKVTGGLALRSAFFMRQAHRFSRLDSTKVKARLWVVPVQEQERKAETWPVNAPMARRKVAGRGPAK